MSLVVGELVGYIRLEDQSVQPALNRTQSALQQAGHRMAATAGQSGTAAGRALGDGVGDGARTGLNGLTTVARREGDQAGQALGDGMTDGARRGMDGVSDAARAEGDDAGDALGDGVGDGAGEAGPGILDKVKGALGPIGGAALAVGGAAGALLMQGLGEAMEQGQVVGKLTAQLGATPEQAKKYGHIAGQMYADAVTEDFQGAADAIGATMSAGIAPPDATNKQIESIATGVHDLSDTFELDLGQAANAAGQMIKTGLVKDGTEALDVMTRGMQVMGPRADDLADTFNEYSTIFRQMGLSAGDATGIMSQGMQAGARDTDVVADALKELTLITQGGGDKVDEAFKKIGLSGKSMQDAFAKGGPTAKKALDQIFDGLRKVKDPADRSQLAVALFGTKAEDMQKALFAIDPSKAVNSLGEVGGAASKMGDSLRDNAGVQIEAFKRGLQQHLVTFLGDNVIPAMTEFKDFVTGRFSGMWDEAAAKTNSNALVDKLLAFFPILAQRMRDKAREIGPRIIEGLTSGGQTAAEWIMANPDKVLKGTVIAGAIVAVLLTLPVLVSGALVTAATLMMVGFTQRLVSALNTAIPAWWAAFTGWVGAKAGEAGSVMSVLGSAIGIWFSSLWSRYVSGPVSRQWALFIGSVRTLPGRASSALAALGPRLSGDASRYFQGMKDAASRKAASMLAWAHGLPGQIGRAIGGLGSLLYGKGQDVVRGLLNGVLSMGGYLRGQLMSFARSSVPGPIAKALGIGSPSKVMAQQVGRWIPAGIVKGIDAGAPALDRTMSNLVSTPSVGSMASGGGGGMAYGGGRAGAGGRPVVEIRSSGREPDDFILNSLRNSIQTKGGDVSYVLTGARGR